MFYTPRLVPRVRPLALPGLRGFSLLPRTPAASGCRRRPRCTASVARVSEAHPGRVARHRSSPRVRPLALPGLRSDSWFGTLGILPLVVLRPIWRRCPTSVRDTDSASTNVLRIRQFAYQQVARVSEAHPGRLVRNHADSRVRPTASPGLRCLSLLPQTPAASDCRHRRRCTALRPRCGCRRTGGTRRRAPSRRCRRGRSSSPRPAAGR